MPALLEEARRLTDLGWRVFPCLPGQKRPRTQNGCKDASIDFAQLKRWFPANAKSNLAIATGPLSRLVVLDVDTAKGGLESLKSLMAQHGALPLTVATKTPSGGGHYYFAWPKGEDIRNRANFLPGLDVRGASGYVVAPPSTLWKPDGEVIGDYTWLTDPATTALAALPSWLLDLIRAHHKQLNGGHHDLPPRPRQNQLGRATLYGEAALEAICDDIAHAPPGAQEVTLRDKALRIGSLIGGGELEEAYAKASLVYAAMRMTNSEAYNPWTVDVVTEKIERHVTYGMRSPSVAPPRENAPLKVVASGERAAGAAPSPKPQVAHSSDDWMDALKWLRGKEGGLRPRDPFNLQQMILHHPSLRGMFHYDAWADRLIVNFGLPGDRRRDYPREFADHDGVAMAMWLAPQGLLPGKGNILDTIEQLARQHWTVNPLQNWLGALKWDGAERISRWLIKYAGVPDAPYARVVGRKFLISAAARALKPGCKVDTMLVLEGAQGAGKSRLLRALAGGPSGEPDDDGYFADQIGGDLTGKDAAQNLVGKWIIEVAEMERLSRAEASAAKEFLSRQEDRYRPSYGRMVIERKRVCVFAGSINPAAGRGYLKDPTGARRFWPVVCGEIDVAAMKADRAQLWAEAVERFLMGEVWWLEGDEETEAVEEQAARTETHPWESALAKWMPDHPGLWSPGELLEQALEVPIGRQTLAMKHDLAKVLTTLGVKTPGKDNRRFIGGRQIRVYEIKPPDERMF